MPAGITAGTRFSLIRRSGRGIIGPTAFGLWIVSGHDYSSFLLILIMRIVIAVIALQDILILQ